MIWGGVIIIEITCTKVCVRAKSLQLCPTLCNLRDPPSGSWDSPGKNTRVGCYALLQEDLPDPEMEPAYLTSLALPDELFTTTATWEALIGQFHPKSPWRWPAIPRSLFMVSHLSLVRSGSVHSWGPGNRFHPQVTSLSSLFKRECSEAFSWARSHEHRGFTTLPSTHPNQIQKLPPIDYMDTRHKLKHIRTEAWQVPMLLGMQGFLKLQPPAGSTGEDWSDHLGQ